MYAYAIYLCKQKSSYFILGVGLDDPYASFPTWVVLLFYDCNSFFTSTLFSAAQKLN